MSEKFHIISDGSCDLPSELVQEKNITVVPFYVCFSDDKYYKEIEEMPIRQFYQHMVDLPKDYPKSSMPSTQDYIDYFTPFVEAKMPILCICITTKFSGSYQSALNAKEMLLEEYPEASIEVMDSTINTVLQGNFVLEAVTLRDAGWSLSDSVRRLNEIKGSGRIFFTVGGIEHLKKNGRIGKVAVVATSALNIRPIITLKEGEIFASGISRGRAKSIEKSRLLLVDYLKERNADVKDYSFDIGYGYDKEEALIWREDIIKMLAENGYTLTEKDIPLYQIGAGIGVHTGPFPLGVTVIEKALK